MGKDHDLLQAVKDNDGSSIQKILQKLGKTSKSKIIGNNKKLNVNFQDGDGMSALHQAALMGSTDVIKLLLEAGASPDLQDNKGMVPLHYATWQGVPEPVQALLHKNSLVNVQALNGETPLHLACQHGHIHVVKLLLTHHADPTICSKDLKTPLDLACEFGRYRVVEQLLKSNLCVKLLEDSPTDTLDNNRTTCLHLAARNGHSDIIRLLIQSGMNIDRSTLNGTCLHEAALYGKTDVVKLLLDCGIDVNKPNSYDQTALDIVNKFTTTRAAKELKQLLKEASFAVQARAVKDYFNPYEPQSLAFKDGDIITVLEQRPDGLWRGYVAQEGRMAKTGVFPSSHVVLVDSQALKQQTKVTPVPDLLSRGPYTNGHTNHNGYAYSDTTSCSSSSTDDSYPPPPHITNALGPPPSAYTSYGAPPSPGYHHPVPVPSSPAPPGHYYVSSSHGVHGGPAPASPGYSHVTSPPVPSSPSPGYASHGAPIPPPSSSGYLPASPCSPHRDAYEELPPTHGFAAYPSAQQSQYLAGKSVGSGHSHMFVDQHAEWAGPVAGAGPSGDMRSASPTHNHSPAHSNRNSAASSDSGRGFSTGHLEPKVVTVIGQHRLSGQSYESGVSSRQSYHSTSSSSLGSLDRLEESGHTSTINVQELLQAGVPDRELLQAWLHDLRFEEYYNNFVQAGYDMPTISRMTPEDLTAIGITKPAHRKRLKAEIARLHISDGIPDFCPHDLMEWLHLLGLGAYHETLANQGYDNIEYVTDITWEDLEEIGIKKLGHQKKIMLAIDRLKRITSGTKRLSSIEPRHASIEMLEPPPPAPPIGRWSGEISALPPHMYDGGLGLGAKPKKSPSGDSISTTGSAGSGSGGSQGSGEVRPIPLPRDDGGMAGAMPYTRQNSSSSTSADVVAIQVKRQARSSTSDETKDVAGIPITYHSFQGQAGKGGQGEYIPPPHQMSTSDPGVSTMPTIPLRVHPKSKPVTMAVARTKRSSRESSPDTEMEKHESECNSDGNKTPPVMSASVAAIAAMMEQSGEVYTGGVVKRPAPTGASMDVTKQLRVETKEHIYDQPQLAAAGHSPNSSPAPHSPKPQVMPKPASPLHVATHHEPPVPSSASPTGRNKKAPPPPPKRTHSIRSDTAPITKVDSLAAFSVTTTASVTAGHSNVNNNGTSISSAAAATCTPKPVQSSASKQTVGSASKQLVPVPNPQKQPVPVLNTQKQPAPVPNAQKQPAPVPNASKQPPPVQEKPSAQPQAFASCVKSLSERFGKKSDMEGSQESLSSDSDEFPPPPPPIAMDIITPKIHNYGIPSRMDGHVSAHSKEFVVHGHQPSHPKEYGFQNRLKQPQHPLPHVSESLVRPEQHVLNAAASAGKQTSPARDVHAGSLPPERPKHSEPNLYTSNLVDKRSESTTSFESTASSSSTDSNTLPFANENVGTIKQRAAVNKPSIIQTFDSVESQRNVDMNVSYEDGVCRTNSSGGAAVKMAYPGAAAYGNRPAANPGAQNVQGVGDGGMNRTVAPGVPQGVHLQAGGSAISRQPPPIIPKPSQGNQHTSSDGFVRPPVPSRKPSQSSVSLSGEQQHQPLPQPDHQQQQQRPPSQQMIETCLAPSSESNVQRPAETGNVLSDIDNMLQDLTDELDAMLKEETSA